MYSTPFAARCVAGYARETVSNCRSLSPHFRMPPAFPHKHIARFPLAFPRREQYENAEYRDRVNSGFPLARARVPASPRASLARPHVLPCLPHGCAPCRPPLTCPYPSRPEHVSPARARAPVPGIHGARPCPSSRRCGAPWRARPSSRVSHVLPCRRVATVSRTGLHLPHPRARPDSAFFSSLPILTLPTNPDIATPLVTTYGSRKALVTASPLHVSAGHSVDVGTGFRNNGARYGSKTHNRRSDTMPSPDSDILDNALTCDDSSTGASFGREKDAPNPSHK
jgi:hypothetical protein